MEGRDITDKNRERTQLPMNSETQGNARACRSSRELGDAAKDSPAELVWGET